MKHKINVPELDSAMNSAGGGANHLSPEAALTH